MTTTIFLIIFLYFWFCVLFLFYFFSACLRNLVFLVFWCVSFSFFAKSFRNSLMIFLCDSRLLMTIVSVRVKLLLNHLVACFLGNWMDIFEVFWVIYLRWEGLNLILSPGSIWFLIFLTDSSLDSSFFCE